MRDSRRNDVPRPRVLALELDRLRAGEGALELTPWVGADDALDRLGLLSGSALAAAWLLAAAREDPDAAAPLCLAIGPCVRRGLPTAARVSIASRAPLTGLYTEGQVGTDLGARLASVADLVVLAGRTDVVGAVLELCAADGDRVRIVLHALPELVGASPVAAARAIAERVGPCAVLCTGPGAERGLPFASLAACGDPPSFVGRGGLGAVLARLGLKAVVVSAAPPEVDRHAEDALRRLLAASPRLRARAEGGTLELAPARAVRDEPSRGTPGDPRSVPADAGQTPASAGHSRASAGAFLRDATERVVERKACRGCPTPCGWVFETPGVGAAEGAARRGGHFSALDPLGVRLGLERFEDAHALLGRCDALGVDAKEAGAVLALWCAARESGRLAGPSPRGDRAALERGLDALLTGEGDGRYLALGALGMARALGLERADTTSKGGAARAEENLAAVLGQCVSSRGADPMRTFPFLVGEGVDTARVAALLAPYPVSSAATDPRSPSEKGRVVVWHENFAAAVDASGFCAFSAAGLLTDGLCTLDELAARIAPEAAALLGAVNAGNEVGEVDAGDAGPGAAGEPERGAGTALLAAGASIVLAQRELNALWGAAPDADRPAWARAALERPGMWDEYRALRGLDPAGRPTRAALARMSTRAVLAFGALAATAAEPGPRSTAAGLAAVSQATAPGRVTLRSFGPLARELGAEATFELELPAAVRSMLEEVAQRVPGARRWLVHAGRPVPAIHRDGRRLFADDAVRDGDELDLVLAIAGGAA